MKRTSGLMTYCLFFVCLTFAVSCTTTATVSPTRDSPNPIAFPLPDKSEKSYSKDDTGVQTESPGPRTRYRRAEPGTAQRTETATKEAETKREPSEAKKERASTTDDSQAPAATQEFKDFSTGLAFNYATPWHIVSTVMAGPSLGKEKKKVLMYVRFITITTDKKAANRPGVLYSVASSAVNAFMYTLSTLKAPVADFLGLGGDDRSRKSGPTPLDIALTQNHFPKFKIERRFRGHDGRSIINVGSAPNMPGAVLYVYHVIEGDKVATFMLVGGDDVKLRIEAEKIIHSTRLP